MPTDTHESNVSPGTPPSSVGNALSTLFEQTAAQRTDGSLQPGSTATPFSTFFWGAIKYLNDRVEADRITAEAPFADDVEWDMMNNGQRRKGKKEVMDFCWSGGLASHKEPAVIHNAATKDWGIWEYWNIGTISEDIITFAKKSQWAFPTNVASLIGHTYKVPVCFVYRINAQGKIDLVREYLDTQSLMAQFM